MSQNTSRQHDLRQALRTIAMAGQEVSENKLLGSDENGQEKTTALMQAIALIETYVKEQMARDASLVP